MGGRIRKRNKQHFFIIQPSFHLRSNYRAAEYLLYAGLKRFGQASHRAGTQRMYLNAAGGRFPGALRGGGELPACWAASGKLNLPLSPHLGPGWVSRQGSEGWLRTKFSYLNKSSVAGEMRKEAAVAGETVSALYKRVKKRPGTQF